MHDLPATLTDRVGFLLRLALARAEALGEAALAGLGVTGREYGVLAVLADRPPSAQHRVGALLGVDRTSTVALVAGLAGRGLVERTRDPANRRAYLVSLTPAGEGVRAAAARALADCDERFLAAVPAADRDRLRAALHLLAEHAGPPAPAPGHWARNQAAGPDTPGSRPDVDRSRR